MIKSVLVTLGIDIGRFASGLNQARSNFSSFIGSIGGGINSAVSFLGHLGDAVELAITAVNGLINAAKGLFDTFVGGIAAEQRLVTQLGVLMGSADQARQFINGVADANLRLGFVTDDMIPAINQGATALKALDGAVDPAKLDQFVDLMRRIKAARPDLDFGTIATTLMRGLRGDIESMKRTLGIGLDDITGLSDKARQTMAALQQTSEQQLGAVTRVGGDTKAKTEDVLSLLDEALGKIGMGEEAVEEYGKSWDAQVARLGEIWDDFKDTVGEPILEVLLDELTKLADWLSEHKEEIKAFAEKIGNLTAEGLKNAIEALMKVDWDKVVEGGEGLVEAFSKIDWEEIGKVLEQVGKLLGGEQSNPVDAGAQAGEAVKGALNTGSQDLFDWLNQTASQLTGQQQEVKVTISVDDDGKIKALAQQEAANAVEDVINTATKSTSSQSGKDKHN